MAASIIDQYVAAAVDHEASKDWMYLDSQGYVTVGVGKMLPDANAATAIAFVNNATRKPATAGEIKTAFAAVQALGKQGVKQNYRAEHFSSKTTLRLKAGETARLLREHVSGDHSRLKGWFDGFDTYPATVQLALHDMAYNLGNVPKKFPSFTASIRKRDWQQAAAQSRRPQLSDKRNQWVAGLLQTASAKEHGKAVEKAGVNLHARPSIQAHNTSTITFRQDSTGPGVMELQHRLNTITSVTHTPLKVDGHFGRQTDQAIRQFQLARGLKPDGVAGPQTQRALGMTVPAAISLGHAPPPRKLLPPSQALALPKAPAHRPPLPPARPPLSSHR